MRFKSTAVTLGIGALLTGAAWVARDELAARYLGFRLQQAQDALQAQQPDAARQTLLSILARDPRHAAARLALAELELRALRREHAYLHYQAATELHPESAAGWLGLARLTMAAGLVVEPEQMLTQALAAAPDQLEARLLRAELRLKLRRFYSAALDARVAAGQAPQDKRISALLSRIAAQEQIAAAEPTPRALAGRAERGGLWPGRLATAVQAVLDRTRREDWSGATQVAAQARADYPGTLFGPWLAGIVELTQNRLDAAEQQFREALRATPRSTRVLTLLARTWSRQKGAAHAADELMILLERDPGFALPWEIVPHAYLEARQPAKAEAALRRGFDWPAAGAIPYRELGEFFLELDRPGDAFRAYQEGLARFPDDLELRLALARLQLRAGERAEAQRALEEALAQAPDRVGIALELAEMLAETADHDARARAASLARQVERDHVDEPELRGALGWVLLRAEDAPADAARHLEAAVEAAPQAPTLRYRLALAYRALGREGEARAALETALAASEPFDERAAAQALLTLLR